MYATVKLEGYPEVWATGYQIMDIVLTLGQQELSTSCQITLADPDGQIGARLIKHSLDNGGIRKLEKAGESGGTYLGSSGDPSPSGAQPTDRQGHITAIIQECLRQGVTDKAQIAYILGTAEHESTMGQFMEEIDQSNWPYYSGGSRYHGRGYVQITHDYNYKDWSRRLRVDLYGNPDLAKDPKYALPILVIGMRDGTFTKTGPLSKYISVSKQDYYGARSVVNGTDRWELIGGYADRFLKGPEIDRVIASQRAQKLPLDTSGQNEGTPWLPDYAPDPEGKEEFVNTGSTVKGNKLIVELAGVTLEFYHQGTEVGSSGTTKVYGQGLRWVLNRRTRNRTDTKTSLKALATKIAEAHKLKLSYEASWDPQYEVIDQHQLTDYQLLYRECDRAGLFLSESQGQITIKELSQIKDSELVLEPGVNLVSWRCKDEALDASKADQGSPLAQEKPKAELDLMSGQVQATSPELDTNKDKSVTGKAPKAQGTLEPESAQKASHSQARVKRVKGLPSGFEIPLDEVSLQIQPLSAIKTKGLPGTLSRIWMVDSVTHTLSKGVTALAAYSPVEVLDTSPEPGAPIQGPGQDAPPGKYIYPVRGFPVTDVRKWRSSTRFHHGIDVGCPTGTPVYAANDGTVVYSSAEGTGGYGNLIEIQHPDGILTKYAHLDRYVARSGQKVKRGQLIAYSGDTGIGSGPHLHWEIRKPSGDSIDPEGLPGSGLSAKVGQVW